MRDCYTLRETQRRGEAKGWVPGEKPQGRLEDKWINTDVDCMCLTAVCPWSVSGGGDGMRTSVTGMEPSLTLPRPVFLLVTWMVRIEKGNFKFIDSSQVCTVDVLF